MKQICITLMNDKQIRLNLYEEYAPITVANFMHLVETKFYEGLIFHRVIKDFMSQGGAYYIDNDQLNIKQIGYTIPGEFTMNGFTNPIMHTMGTISMARTNDPNSASSQFFICDADTPNLDGQYAAFGIVTDQESLDVVHGLSAFSTYKVADGMENFPAANIEDITIKSIDIL